jgi:hypothetical protein
VTTIFVLLLLTIGFGWLAYENPEFFESKESEQAEIVSDHGSPLTMAEGDFIEGEHRLLVVANCTGCHSSKLVTQNRATREGWTNMIRWMQRTQNLKDLGTDEEKILDYLTKNYAPTEQGRRANLVVDQWYELK